MDRWYWCDPAVNADEATLHTVFGIRLYDGDKKTAFDNGRLTLTKHRLIFCQENSTGSLGLRLPLIILLEEEPKTLTASAKLVLHLSAPTEVPASRPVTSSQFTHIKLSFRQSGFREFHKNLSDALAEKSWEKNLVTSPAKLPSGRRPIHAGILGIERAIHAKQQETNQSISVAFEDLKTLMNQAKEMVVLSRNISSKIRERSGEISADETTQFRSYLLSLGIEDPVTRDTFGKATDYHRHLCQELCQALETPVRESGGVMLLSEVYCRMNRARGLHLLSPEDVLNACLVTNASSVQLPLRLHTFESGVQVLQLAGLDEQKIAEATRELLLLHEIDGVSAADAVQECGLPLLLARERLLQAERAAVAVRDETSEGLRFYPNLFFTKN